MDPRVVALVSLVRAWSAPEAGAQFMAGTAEERHFSGPECRMTMRRAITIARVFVVQ
jgi:hypothetical protein